jgi:hypothetical protein
MKRILVVSVAAATALAAVGVATAAREQQTLICNGEPLTLTVTTTTSEQSVAWGVGTVSRGSHIIPTSFTFRAVDLSAGGTTLVSSTQVKGDGNGMHKEPSITCAQSQQTTAGALGIPNLPPDEVIDLDFIVTAVPKG